MRVIISGYVTANDLQNAEEFFGIKPTSFVTNSLSSPPIEYGAKLPTWAYPIDPKLGAAGEIARDYTLVQNADAAVIMDGNEHLAKLVEQYKLPMMFEASYV